jgi:hypothetical protein
MAATIVSGRPCLGKNISRLALLTPFRHQSPIKV